MPRFAATERLGTSVAPELLLFTQELVNTQGPLVYEVDLLADLGQAQEWLDGLLEDAGAPAIRLRKADLERLREVRAELHQVFEPEQHRPRLRAPIAVSAGPDGIEASAVGTGIDWLASAIALELFRAQEHDLLRRLKFCQNPGCTVAFFDRSKNNSRAWHDVTTCGNRANVRAYRERQRGLTSP